MKTTKPKKQKSPQRYRLVTDNDGHDYVIPVSEEDAFYAWVAVEEGDGVVSIFGNKDYNECRVNRPITFTDPRED